jgi:hypothetical protein
VIDIGVTALSDNRKISLGGLETMDADRSSGLNTLDAVEDTTEHLKRENSNNIT